MRPRPSTGVCRNTIQDVPSPESSSSRRDMGGYFPHPPCHVKAERVVALRPGLGDILRDPSSRAGNGLVAFGRYDPLAGLVGTKRTILVVEDERDIRELIRFHLEREGFTVREADGGEVALRQVAGERPALILLDLMLPGTDGLEVCRRLRADPATRALPIIMLTARAEEVDRVLGLELGADDYVTKPFSPRELMARVRAVLRRAYGEDLPLPHEIFERGRLRVDFDTYEASVDGERAGLSLREFELLKFFVTHPHRVYDRLQLLDLVWGRDVHVEPRTVDVHVRRLRKRIERDDTAPELIVTVRGVGYKFNPDALES